MFKQVTGRQVLSGNVIEKMVIEAASLGGGFIVSLHHSGRVDTLVFDTQQRMMQGLFAMFNAASLAAMAGNAPAGAVQPNMPTAVTQDALTKMAKSAEAPRVDSVKAEEPKKKRGGRPKLSEEEKAANRARKAAQKANGADHDSKELPAGAKVEAPAEAEVPVS